MRPRVLSGSLGTCSTWNTGAVLRQKDQSISYGRGTTPVPDPGPVPRGTTPAAVPALANPWLGTFGVSSRHEPRANTDVSAETSPHGPRGTPAGRTELRKDYLGASGAVTQAQALFHVEHLWCRPKSVDLTEESLTGRVRPGGWFQLKHLSAMLALSR